MATKRLPRPRDPIQLGKLMVDIATGQVEDKVENSKDENAAAFARSGGIKGGPARAATLSPSRKSEIAKLAAQARWSKKKT